MTRESMTQEDSQRMTITEFLAARVAEDERNNDADVDPVDWCDRVAGTHYEHARIAAECAAKRKMLDNIPKSSDIFDPLGGTSEYVLRCLASVYANHPDYDQRWAL